ncbi:MAG: DUF6288 domain-containing protein [Luteolibacter sp.]
MISTSRRPKARHIVLVLALSLASGERLHAQFIEHKERHLGPTGLYGITSPKDIRITKIEPGSPADGKITVGATITGAGGIAFKDDTRKQLAAAIDRAEATGTLSLTLADGGAVDLALPAIGAYSDTAPHDCAKTNAIISRAAAHLVKTRAFGRQDMNIGLLGLLATGEAEYIDVVRREIHAAGWARPDIRLSLEKYNRTAWSWGYTNLLLAEYYLLTRDAYVLPALEAYSVAIASGRDAAGLWGHGMATLDLNEGKSHGRLPGYAVMNQSSLPCFLSLLLADKAGVRHPEIRECIAQTHGFYSDFIGKGTLPYGVHDPNSGSYNNNGMSGLAAVAFAQHGNKEGAAFFSRMSLASHGSLETGHTGHFFNQLWSGPGTAVAGPSATRAFFKESRWLHILNRKWDGSFTYDCSGYKEPIYSYRGLSDTGSHLINHCIGRRALYITGREADPALHLGARESIEFASLATLDPETLSDAELLRRFGHPLPKPRHDAVRILRQRESGPDAEIIAMIRNGGRDQRLSAIAFFGQPCPPERAMPAIEPLAAVLRDPQENPEFRAAAAGTLAALGEKAYPYFNDMLRLVAADEPADPRGLVDKQVGQALNILCADPHGAGLITDKPLFHQAVRKLLTHRRADGRASGTRLLAQMPLEDFHHVGDLLQHIVADRDRTYHSYHNLGPHTGALGILANLKVEGGVEAAFGILESDLGKFGFKVRMLMEVLPKYGAAAKPALPKLKAMNIDGRFEKGWQDMIAAIENATEPTETIRFQDAMKAGAATPQR